MTAPETRGRISTARLASKRPTNSSHSVISRWSGTETVSLGGAAGAASGAAPPKRNHAPISAATTATMRDHAPAAESRDSRWRYIPVVLKFDGSQLVHYPHPVFDGRADLRRRAQPSRTSPPREAHFPAATSSPCVICERAGMASSAPSRISCGSGSKCFDVPAGTLWPAPAGISLLCVQCAGFADWENESRRTALHTDWYIKRSGLRQSIFILCGKKCRNQALGQVARQVSTSCSSSCRLAPAPAWTDMPCSIAVR